MEHASSAGPQDHRRRVHTSPKKMASSATGDYFWYTGIQTNLTPFRKLACAGECMVELAGARRVLLSQIIDFPESFTGEQYRYAQLQIAIANNHAWKVALLLKSDACGLTWYFDCPFRNACLWGLADIACLLLDKGADPTAKDSEALRAACKYGHTDVVRLLLEDGRADLSANHYEAIVQAIRNRHEEILALLQERPEFVDCVANQLTLKKDQTVRFRPGTAGAMHELSHADVVYLLEHLDRANICIEKRMSTGGTPEIAALVRAHPAYIAYLEQNPVHVPIPVHKRPTARQVLMHYARQKTKLHKESERLLEAQRHLERRLQRVCGTECAGRLQLYCDSL